VLRTLAFPLAHAALTLRPKLTELHKLALALGLCAVLPGCGGGDGGDAGDEASDATTTNSETDDSADSTAATDETDGDSGDGTPEAMWCYGEPGPNPDWAFAAAEGEFEMSAAAACLPTFTSMEIYDLVIDAAAKSVSITTDQGSRSYTWDGDEFDASSADGGLPDGGILVVAEDIKNGVERGVRGGGTVD